MYRNDLSDTQAVQASTKLRNAGWSEEQAARGALVLGNAKLAAEVAQLDVPADLREVILADTKRPFGEARVQAFREAAEIAALCKVAASLPQTERDAVQFIRCRVPLAEVRARLANALGDRDEHIDTARPSGALQCSIGRHASIVDRDAMVRMYGEDTVKKMEAER